jgi:AcrR family transcriptional regulator
VAEVADGRAAQRRRARLAIVAAKRLVAEGASPSVNEIAEAADVSRRAVYRHFTSLDHLLFDLRGLDADEARAVVLDAAPALLDAAT